jgi:hypothetical protein
MNPFHIRSLAGRKVRTGQRHGKSLPSPRRRHILTVEKLEDRTVPSGLQIIQTQSFGNLDLIPQSLPNLQQFDAQGGYRTLDSVQVQASSSIQSTLSGSISNNSTSQSATYQASVTDALTSVAGPGLGSPVSNSISPLLSYGPVTIAPQTTLTFPSLTPTLTASSDATLTSPGALATFIGTGNLDPYVTDATAVANDKFTGSANISRNYTFVTTGQASVTLTYNYHTNPMIGVTEVATSIQEGGVGNQDVTYTYTVQNTNPDSIGHPLTLTQLTDDKLGDLLAATAPCWPMAPRSRSASPRPCPRRTPASPRTTR